MRGITSRSTDLFSRTPNVFLENVNTKPTTVTLHLPRLQTLLLLADVLWCRLFAKDFLTEMLLFVLQTWLMTLRPSQHPQRCPQGDRLFITHYRDTRQWGVGQVAQSTTVSARVLEMAITWRNRSTSVVLQVATAVCSCLKVGSDYSSSIFSRCDLLR
jgi:hypothetical protein